VSIIAELLLLSEYEAEDQRIIDSAMELWVSSLLDMHNLAVDFYGHTSVLGADHFILTGLTTSKHANIRKQFSNSLYQIAMKVEATDEHPSPLTWLL
jgi:hypothetical protein